MDRQSDGSSSKNFLLGLIISYTCLCTTNVSASCQDYLNPSVAQAWRNFHWTSPTDHNADDFRYRVHAVPPLYVLNRSLEQIFDRINASYDPVPVSFSVITNEHRDSIAGRNGFILEFEPEQIIVAHSDDLKSFIYLQRPNWFEAIRGDYSIQTPSQMLNKRAYMWNEGLVFTGKETRIIGAYGYKQSEDAKALEEFAKTKKIPFVWLN